MNQITQTIPSGTPAEPASPAELTFESAYARLGVIARRLNEEEVPVSEMCDLFAEGRGLELACIEFLDTERRRVEAIERGEGVRAFRITRAAPSSAREMVSPGQSPLI